MCACPQAECTEATCASIKFEAVERGPVVHSSPVVVTVDGAAVTLKHFALYPAGSHRIVAG
jgi:hypothetical protein